MNDSTVSTGNDGEDRPRGTEVEDEPINIKRSDPLSKDAGSSLDATWRRSSPPM